MKVCIPNYYKDFVCSASECIDTCCKFWQVEVDKDIYSIYKNAVKNSTELGSCVKKHLSVNCGVHFKNTSDEKCPFLDNNQLCSLHSKFGYDILPKTCKAFPRFYNTFGFYEESGLSFSCPTAAKLICFKDSNLIEFVDNREIESLTNVNADLFLNIKNARNKIYSFICNYEGDINCLIASILSYSKAVQKCIAKKHYVDILNIKLQTISETNVDFFTADFCKKAIKKHKKYNILRPEWNDILDMAYNHAFDLSEDESKIWLAYFVFRYLIKSADDTRFLSRVKASIYSLSVIGCINTPFIDAAQRYSKEVEHNVKNIRVLLKEASSFVNF